MDRQVRPVEQRLEGLVAGRRVVVRDEVLRLLEQVLGAVRLDVLAGLDEVEVGRRQVEVGHALPGERLRDHRVGLGPERQLVLGLRRARLALGVVERPLVQRQDGLPGLDDDLLAELDRLGEDDLLLGGEQGDLADLLEVHPDRVVDPDHVGGQRLELLAGRLVHGVGRQLGGRLHALGHLDALDRLLLDDLDRELGGAGLRVLVGREIEVLVVVIVEVGVRVGGHRGGRGARTPGPHRRQLRFLELALGAARARREHGLDELLVQGIGHVRGSSEGSGAWEGARANLVHPCLDLRLDVGEAALDALAECLVVAGIDLGPNLLVHRAQVAPALDRVVDGAGRAERETREQTCDELHRASPMFPVGLFKIILELAAAARMTELS